MKILSKNYVPNVCPDTSFGNQKVGELDRTASAAFESVTGTVCFNKSINNFP